MLLDHESCRLAALQSYDILDTSVEEDFDKITTMCGRLLDVELACMTLVDKDRFFFKSTAGTDVRNMDRRPGFCDTAIQQAGVYCIEDASTDPIVRDHPLVLDPPYVKFYAGAPLITSERFAIGTLCLMGTRIRTFTEAEKELLHELAEFVMFQLDKRRHQAEAARYEEEKRNVQKLESLGMLAGGIAHDFNNLLVGVLGNASLASRQIDADNPAQETLASVIRAASQASELTDQLLTYAGQRPMSPIAVDLSRLMDNMSPLLLNTMSTHTTLKIDCAKDLCPAIRDPTQMRQVILNLVSNASDAYGGDGGCVQLKLSRTVVGPAGADDDFGADLKPGEYVRINVRDAGCGMDVDTLRSLFSPFFSTKVSGRGLGMAIVQRIVRSHGGAIQVESALGEGCTVSVLWPADSVAIAAASEQPAPRTTMVKGDGTVLVVDDEELVMKTTASAIKTLGFNAIGAATGGEALLRLKELESVAILILDATMDGANGTSVLKVVRESWPEIPAVISSGHHIDEVVGNYHGFDRVTFLQKPWTLEELASAIQYAMHSPEDQIDHSARATG